ncbi:CLUMA_CG009410, isoform A [Clunio marinus]|uniref:CLUMA_CG009410, isoform A n=1 Tax=Clunio marinus TaxID=568069 RepID=A0A1J1IC06_9DIPT|nr:CLUMA_CG009410, isoform A [Clunio marinus]
MSRKELNIDENEEEAKSCTVIEFNENMSDNLKIEQGYESHQSLLREPANKTIDQHKRPTLSEPSDCISLAQLLSLINTNAFFNIVKYDYLCAFCSLVGDDKFHLNFKNFLDTVETLLNT